MSACHCKRVGDGIGAEDAAKALDMLDLVALRTAPASCEGAGARRVLTWASNPRPPSDGRSLSTGGREASKPANQWDAYCRNIA